MNAPRRAKVAMVIGSGGLRCVSAYGALRVLQREGIPIDMVVACSGGAMCGYWIATGRDDAALGVELFRAGWLGTFDNVAYRKILGALFPRLFGFDPKFGLIRDESVNRALASYVGETRFEDLNLPMHYVATDVISGDKVVLSKGKVFDAMRATISIPLVFPPWEVDGRLLMDGAVSNPLPVDVAIREGADIIIAIGYEETLQPGILSGLGLVKQVTNVAINHLLRAQYAFHSLAHHAEIIPIIPDFGTEVGLKDMHLIPHLVEQGAIATEREVPYLLRLLKASEGAAA
ncbi:MAG TPA: patatin-like phospholipase family protein [Burkholderiaceae bacterium]